MQMFSSGKNYQCIFPLIFSNNYTFAPPPRIAVRVSFFYTTKHPQILSPLLYAVLSDAWRGAFFVFSGSFYTFEENFTYCKNALCPLDERYLI